MVPHIMINFNLGTRQSRLAKHVCKHKVNDMAKPRKSITLPRSKFQNFLCKPNIKLSAYTVCRFQRMYGATHCDKLQSRHKRISSQNINNHDLQNAFVSKK